MRVVGQKREVTVMKCLMISFLARENLRDQGEKEVRAFPRQQNLPFVIHPLFQPLPMAEGLEQATFI